MTDVDIQPLSPPALPESVGGFTHGTVTTGARRTLHISGQVPWRDEDGKVPEDFETQCRLAWRNLLAVLTEAGMAVQNLVKVTTFLADRCYREAYGRIRAEFLGDHRTAITIVVTDIYAEDWLLEIEAVAMD